MLQTHRIDYSLLGAAQQYYRQHNFMYVETPWIVPENVAMITSPGQDFNFYAHSADASVEHGVLTASAEQSFLSLIENGASLSGYRYQSITPCFRNEAEDDTHSKWFIKLELFKRFDNTNSKFFQCDLQCELNYFLEKSMGFFKDNVPDSDKLQLKTIDKNCCDINYNNIEIGSYGIRSHKNYTWVYGTGLALPRFSYATVADMD